MKIKMKTAMAGPDGTASPGDIIDIPKSQAYAFIEGGYAEQVEDRAVEAAVVPATENAVDPAVETAVEPAAEIADPVIIPGGWRKMSAAEMKELAGDLGADVKNKTEAKAAIEAAGG